MFGIDQSGDDFDATPFGGELDGVGEEVVKDLLEFSHVLFDEGDGGIVVEGEFDIFAFGEGADHVDEAFGEVVEGEFDDANFHPSAFDFGEIEDVVDEDEEILAGGLDVANVALLAFVEVDGVGEDIAEAEDAVERGAEFVAHGGHEVAFEIVHLEEGEVDLGEFVDLTVEIAVDLPEFLLNGDEVTEHAVEGVAEFLEFVASTDVRSEIEVAAGDGVADILEVEDGLDDDVADDGVGGDHGQEGSTDGGGEQQGVVHGEGAIGIGEGDIDLGHAEEVPFLEVGDIDRVTSHAGLGGADGTVVAKAIRTISRLNSLGKFVVAEGEFGENVVIELFAGPFGGIFTPRLDERPAVVAEFGGLEVLRHGPEDFFEFLISFQFEGVPVLFVEDGGDEQLAEDAVLIENGLAGVSPVEEEGARNEEKESSTEEKSALPFEAGFTQESFEGAIRHEAG